MKTPREIALALPALHAMLNAVRPEPVRIVELAGARIGVRPGEDSPWASATKNRATVYDPRAAKLSDTLRGARSIYAEAGVEHWFAEIGPGAEPGEIEMAMHVIGARRVPYVRYPVLARAPAEAARPATTLEVRPVGAEEAAARVAEIDAIWDRPGASGAAANAAGREGYALVGGFADGRAVAMGMLLVAQTGGLRMGYLASGGTSAAYRGRGGQSAIIAERVRIAREMGCDVCVSETVSAVETSENNLLRAGFARVFEWAMLGVGTPTGMARS